MNGIRTRLAPYLKQTPSVAALRIIKRVFRRWLEWGTLVFLEQDMGLTPPVPGSATPEIRELTIADLPALRSFGRDQADLEWRLTRGDRAFAFFETGSSVPVHVRWATTQATWIPEVGLWLHPRPGEFYLYDVMTNPRHRGRRIAGQVGGAMDEAFANQGFRTKIGYVRKDNVAMLRSMQWAGVPLRPLFEISYIRWRRGEPRVCGTLQPPLSRKSTRALGDDLTSS